MRIEVPPLMEHMNILKFLFKTRDALIALHIPTELQLSNSFQNKLKMARIFLCTKDLPNNYRNSLSFQVPRGNLMP